MALIIRRRRGGKLVAMTGDGTTMPLLLLRQMSGPREHRDPGREGSGNMVDLDSPYQTHRDRRDGKQLLMTVALYNVSHCQ